MQQMLLRTSQLLKRVHHEAFSGTWNNSVAGITIKCRLCNKGNDGRYSPIGVEWNSPILAPILAENRTIICSVPGMQRKICPRLTIFFRSFEMICRAQKRQTNKNQKQRDKGFGCIMIISFFCLFSEVTVASAKQNTKHKSK